MRHKRMSDEMVNATANHLIAVSRERKAALRTRGEVLVEEALSLRAAGAKEFWRLGRVLMTMRDENVHLGLGYERLDDLFVERVEIARTVAWKLVAVAEGLPQTEAMRLGQEKAYALLALARAMPGGRDPLAMIHEDTPILGKPLSRASLRVLQAALVATRSERPPTQREQKRLEAARELVDALNVRLDGLGLPKRLIALEGDEIVVRWHRRQTRHLLPR